MPFPEQMEYKNTATDFVYRKSVTVFCFFNEKA